ncbi:hypothetical protein [Microbacterium trichothecenolyticum]|uniref:Uncharacterized protein n=1 Tax=Microbacterium trichothecenolyticum TaxID=69370 RepID=A0ABU0TS47_MICTR|nr:hypothetical protein [Microbacterium trichothecenolyticum]MDQ1122496.1 hypothetical protein [Microbacterium trichothecenolyticum]
MTDQNPHDDAAAPDAESVRDVDATVAPHDPEHRSADDSRSSSGSASTSTGRDETGASDAASPDQPFSAAADEHGTSAASGQPPTGQALPGSAPSGHGPSGDAPNVGVGPFSVREVALLGVWVVAFFVSFFRTNILDSPSGVLVGGVNVWSSGLWWIPAIALPTVAVGLVVLRRLSPQGIRRVGSLGIDQFASVAFSVAALVWFSWIWDTVAVYGDTAIWTRSWVIWVEAALMLAGVVLTVAAPWIRPFSLDFRGRDEVAAHRNARPIRPVVPRPRTPRSPRPQAVAAAEGQNAHVDTDGPVPGSYTGSTDLAHDAAPATSVLPAHGDDHNTTDVFAPLRTEDEGQGVAGASGHVETEEHDAPHHAQAFWALAPVERDVVDDYGTPIFRIGPTAWALVVEDRGETFVIRHDDGRIGYLHDVSGVTRG